jgi:hypothetical protein
MKTVFWNFRIRQSKLTVLRLTIINVYNFYKKRINIKYNNYYSKIQNTKYNEELCIYRNQDNI